MHDAAVDLGLRENGVYGFGKAVEPVDERDQDVIDSPSLELGHHAMPELGSLGLLDPETQHLLRARAGDA